jgi:hypothetical protein
MESFVRFCCVASAVMSGADVDGDVAIKLSAQDRARTAGSRGCCRRRTSCRDAAGTDSYATSPWALRREAEQGDASSAEPRMRERNQLAEDPLLEPTSRRRYSRPTSRRCARRSQQAKVDVLVQGVQSYDGEIKTEDLPLQANPANRRNNRRTGACSANHKCVLQQTMCRKPQMLCCDDNVTDKDKVANETQFQELFRP